MGDFCLYYLLVIFWVSNHSHIVFELAKETGSIISPFFVRTCASISHELILEPASVIFLQTWQSQLQL